MTDIRDAFFDELYKFMSEDDNIVILTADYGAFGLNKIKTDFPNQYLNVGIAEQNAIDVAAGLCLCGKKVFVYAIINFITLRCLEQININAGGMQLDINIVGAGPGLIYSTDGPTHHGVQDVAIMSCIPHLKIYNTTDAVHAADYVKIAISTPGPKYFRLSKGQVDSLYEKYNKYEDGMKLIRDGNNSLIISSGLMVHRALRAVEISKKNVGVLDIYRLKPINKELLVETVRAFDHVIILEDNMESGGLSEKIKAILFEKQLFVKMSCLCLKDKHNFQYGPTEPIHDICNIGVNKIVEIII